MMSMSERNIRRLPLLEAFHAIMLRGSVGAAAEVMGVTQSAVSKQLAQLRTWLGDELFVRTRDGMQPTPRALALREPVEEILRQSDALTTEAAVDPATFAGRFVISATDELQERLVPALVDRLGREAPQMRLVTLPLAPDYSLRQLEAGQVNLLLGVNWHAPEPLHLTKLGEDPFVCVMGSGHPLATKNLTVKRYAAATHVLVAPLGHDVGVVDTALDDVGLSRRVCASVSSFHVVDPELLGDTRIATLPSRVAARLTRGGACVTKPVPLALPITRYFALWHPRFDAEPRLRWMLDAVKDAFDA